MRLRLMMMSGMMICRANNLDYLNIYPYFVLYIFPVFSRLRFTIVFFIEKPARASLRGSVVSKVKKFKFSDFQTSISESITTSSRQFRLMLIGYIVEPSILTRSRGLMPSATVADVPSCASSSHSILRFEVAQ